jgi:glucokinase
MASPMMNSKPQDPPERKLSDTGLHFGRPVLLREVNARQLLRLLRRHGPCSRADLVRHSGLSAPTVSSSVAYLQGKGLVEPIGPGRSNGGRRPGLLRFNARLGYVAATDIGRSVIRVAVADLHGTLVERWLAPTEPHATPERVCSQVAQALRQIQIRRRIPTEKIFALAASVPGITNPLTGLVVSVPNFAPPWEAVPLREIIEAETGIPTAVENDVNLAARAEHWCGAAQAVRDFVFVSIGTGVGAGIFLNGSLYQGPEWTAGEIAYLYLPGTEEAPVALRRRGPLESAIGSKGIQQYWNSLIRAQSDKLAGLRPDLEAVDILSLAAQEVPEAQAVLNRTARILADAVTNVCVILNSSLVVLGGRVGTHPALFAATRRIVQRNEFSRPQLAVSSLGREAQLFGAVWLALSVADARILPASTEQGSGLVPGEPRLSPPVLGFLPPG